MLNKKFENAEGFWPDFYRNLDAQKNNLPNALIGVP